MNRVPLFILDSNSPCRSDGAARRGNARDWLVLDVSQAGRPDSKDTTLRSIREATVVIGDLSSTSRITLELLGLAAGLGKPIVGLTIEPGQEPRILEPVSSVGYDLKDSELDIWRKTAGAATDLHMGQLSDRPMEAAKPTPPLVFVSYCHADRAYLDRLHVHLRPLERENSIQVWSDLQLKPGVEWQTEIGSALRRARVAILLVSADFIASDFIANNELPPLLNAAQTSGTKIFSLILSASRFERDARLSMYQAVNDPRRPLASLLPAERESILDSLAQQVERTLGQPR